MISIKCTECGQILNVPDEAAGREGRCPSCRTTIQVPQYVEVKPVEHTEPTGFGSKEDYPLAATAEANPDAEFFYMKEGKRIGPVNWFVLKSMVGTGQLLSGDMVWTTGAAGWIPACQLPGLFSPATGAGPPLPAALMGHSPSVVVVQQAGGASSTKEDEGSHQGKAIAGFVCSLAGFLLFGLELILGVIGLILSSVALNGMKQSGNRKGRGMAIAGLVIGIIDIVGAILIIVWWSWLISQLAILL